MSRKDVTGILLTLLALSMSTLVLNVAVRQAKAAPDPWEMPVLYAQGIYLPGAPPGTPNKLRVNVAVYNLTNTFYPTNDEWVEGGPLGTYVEGDLARYNYSLGNLYAFDLTLRWNPAVLSYISHDKTAPRTAAYQPFRSKGILNAPVVQAEDTVGADSCRVAYSSQYPAASFNAPLDAANAFSVTFAVLAAGDYGIALEDVSLVVDNIAFPSAQPMVPYRVVLDPDLEPNVGVDAAPRNKDVVGETKAFDTYALVKNTGASARTFDVKIYAGATQVGTASSGSVAPGTAVTVKVACSTTGLAKGTYTLKAQAVAVGGETYTTDNEITQGSIIVTLAGDVDGSKNVNIFDIVKMASGYGAVNQAATNYDPYSDLDNDYKINIFDIVTAAGNYGKSWT
jgi:hypothetical protein